ncbi:hypothetical protein C4D60_Mb04t17770 [Musa balbisiana]|uniref:Uncharacterized protein n=1 Tax=Musa balbisiana TaxID=52838 RepID=A0A4S8KCT7_MUSBA|nr:hypothetical protein C4D60_Mb04t17770 [Musa balbisiana]
MSRVCTCVVTVLDGNLKTRNEFIQTGVYGFSPNITAEEATFMELIRFFGLGRKKENPESGHPGLRMPLLLRHDVPDEAARARQFPHPRTYTKMMRAKQPTSRNILALKHGKVIPIRVLALPTVHREGQVLILDIARLHAVTRELGGVHGHGAVRAREGQEGVGSDHAGAVGVDGPRDPAVGGLQRPVGDVDRAIGRVVVPVEGGIEVGERAAGVVQLVAGERVVDTALRCAVVQRRQEQAQEDDCWLHGGGPDCRDASSFSSRRIREEMGRELQESYSLSPENVSLTQLCAAQWCNADKNRPRKMTAGFMAEDQIAGMLPRFLLGVSEKRWWNGEREGRVSFIKKDERDDRDEGRGGGVSLPICLLLFRVITSFNYIPFKTPLPFPPYLVHLHTSCTVYDGDFCGDAGLRKTDGSLTRSED